ncbi:MAG: hypothetical protein NVS3B26_17280 [Mycobacteriales bacterium]
MAAFYGTGGVLCLVSLIVPAWSGRNDTIVLAVGMLATAVAAALRVARRWLSTGGCYVLVLFGSLLIAALLYAGAGGAASATYAGFYVWVAVYSFLFFPPRGAIVQMLVALVSEVLALLQAGQGAVAPAQVVLNGGTVLATGAVVGLLSARLRTLTLTDELTGLPNRRCLDVALQDRLGRDRTRKPVAVLGVDLDGFKALNDSQGHAAGDDLLRAVAAAWSAELRHGDLLARNGGDEFIAVLNDCDAETAQAVAARMVAVIPAPVSACVGLVVVPGGKSAPKADITQLLATVDQALYEGKSKGSGNVVAFPETSLVNRSAVPMARRAAQTAFPPAPDAGAVGEARSG